MAAPSTPSEPEIEIRAPHTDDQVAGDLPAPPPDTDTPRWRRTLVAVLDEDVVAVGNLSLAPATETYFCHVEVSAHHRRRRIGTTLYRALHALAEPPRLVISRGMDSHPDMRAFAVHLGGSVLAHCPMPSIDPTGAAGRDWISAQSLPDGYATVPMAEVALEEVTAAWSSYFVWAHEPFGTVRADALPAVWDGYGNGVDDRLSQLCVDTGSGQIVALSLVSPDSWEGRTFVVAETVHRVQADGLRLLQSTVAASLRELAARGIQRVEIEGHSTDAHAPQLFESLPPAPADPMDLYVLPAPAQVGTPSSASAG